MKYRRKFVTGLAALALLTNNTSAWAAEDLIPESRIEEYHSQVKMKPVHQKHDVSDRDISSKSSKKSRNIL